MIARPVMRYPGGKYLLAKWVVEHFPPHRTYVELFGGAASVLMRKPRSVGEIFNELDDDVVNVFRVLRDPAKASELARLLELTPFAIAEYKEAYGLCEDPVERARRMIFRSFAGVNQDSALRYKYCFGGGLKNDMGQTKAASWANYPAQIKEFVSRLQGVVIENRPALRVIDIYDDDRTLFYADPPYVKSSRGKNGSVRYQYEMTDEEHQELAERLHSIKGLAIISGYRSELYDHLYTDFMRVERSAHAGAAKKRRSTKRVECLWLSPNIKSVMF
jgi:DNA adenine methylase